MCSVGDDAVPAEVDESQSPTKPIVVLETFSLANNVCCVICYIQFMMIETISAYGLGNGSRSNLSVQFYVTVRC